MVNPLAYLVELDATHLMNAITSTGIYCFYPRLTLKGEALADPQHKPLAGWMLSTMNRKWSRSLCSAYCPRRIRDTENDKEILSYTWKQPLNRGDSTREGASLLPPFIQGTHTNAPQPVNRRNNWLAREPFLWSTGMLCMNPLCGMGPQYQCLWDSPSLTIEGYNLSALRSSRSDSSGMASRLGRKLINRLKSLL
jgi:hypothetical protein